MENFRNQFPALRNQTYLNTAALGLLSESLLEWRQEHDLDLLLKGSVFREEQSKIIEDVRQTLARFFNGKTKNTALLPNLSFGLNTLLEGIANDTEVLLIADDYPSINWPVEQRKFKINYAALNTTLEENIEKAFDLRVPDVFIFSLVQYTNGVVLDLSFLTELKANYPNTMFIADGTQFCGTQRFDFQASPIDILLASGYKWLLGGYGNGFVMFKEETTLRFFPKTIGFNSTNISLDKEKMSFAGFFQPGHQDSLVLGSLGQGVKFLQKIGLTHIEGHLKKLSDRAKETLASKGFIGNEIALRKQHSSIFNIKGDNTLFKKLVENDVVCAQRGGGIRISFHFYNNLEDLDRLFSLLPS